MVILEPNLHVPVHGTYVADSKVNTVMFMLVNAEHKYGTKVMRYGLHVQYQTKYTVKDNYLDVVLNDFSQKPGHLPGVYEFQ